MPQKPAYDTRTPQHRLLDECTTLVQGLTRLVELAIAEAERHSKATDHGPRTTD